jgi:hypothetical protein
MEIEPPEYRGRAPSPAPGQFVEAWSPSLDDDAWSRIEVRDGRRSLVVER